MGIKRNKNLTHRENLFINGNLEQLEDQLCFFVGLEF